MARTVLVVDDDPHIRQLLVFALEKAGLVAREAADGEAALAAVGEARPDLVVLDINMPKLDGLEVCRRLRALGHQLGLCLADQGVLVDPQEQRPDARHGGGEQQHREQDRP